jgi:hypothetical protein
MLCAYGNTQSSGAVLTRGDTLCCSTSRMWKVENRGGYIRVVHVWKEGVISFLGCVCDLYDVNTHDVKEDRVIGMSSIGSVVHIRRITYTWPWPATANE